MFLTSLKQICNEYLIKFSENQSAPKLENRKTSPCSPCSPNLLHVLVSRTVGYHNLCNPADRLNVNCSDLISFILQLSGFRRSLASASAPFTSAVLCDRDSCVNFPFVAMHLCNYILHQRITLCTTALYFAALDYIVHH